jgi:tetratricopeptide (TPR) repeat protein
MTDPQITVFISYRRSVASYIARAVFMDLRAHGYDVFMDVESIDSGEFERVILGQIAARAHFVLVLTPGTLDRCGEPGDWLRREIEHAMNLERNVVPLLANGFQFDDAAREHLTGALEKLSRYNALNVPHDFFDEAMQRLRTRYLKPPVYADIQPAPAADVAAAQRKIEQAAAEPAPTEADLTAEGYLSQSLKRDENDLDGKIADYAQAIRLKPDYADAYFGMGGMRHIQGDYVRAIADYDEALRLKPDFAAAYVCRGITRYAQGDVVGALADYDKALRLKPDDAYAYINRGFVRHVQGDYVRAIADYDEALRLKPDDVTAHKNRGLVRAAQGDVAGALADFDEVLRLRPDDADAYYNRGGAWYVQDDHARAIADYNEAIRLKPDYAEAYNNRAEAHFALGNHDQALEDFKQANDLMPGFNFALAGLAITYHALGNIGEAVRLWGVLAGMNANYRDPEWVRNELNWVKPLAEEARKLIARL